MSSIYRLPPECSKRVFDRLDFMDRLLLELVNETWRQTITFDDIKCFRLSDLSSYTRKNALAEWHYRPPPRVDPLRSIDKDWSIFDEFTLKQILQSVLSRCKNLKRLSFAGVDDSSEESAKFKILLTKDVIRLLKKEAPQIQSIDLCQCAITDEALLRLLKKNRRNLVELNLNECILVPTDHYTDCSLEQYVDDALRRMRALKRLNPSIYSLDALRLPEAGLRSLTSLELTNKTPLADEQLMQLWTEDGDRPNPYKIQTLVLSDSYSLRRFDVVSHLPTLRSLTLHRLSRLCDEHLLEIFNSCHMLTRVDLVDCQKVRFQRFRWPSNLTYLRILEPSTFESEDVKRLGEQCPKLKGFELRMRNLQTNCPDSNAYLSLATGCSELRSVVVDVATVPNGVLFYFAAHCSKLEQFRCSQTAMETNAPEANRMAPKANLKHLDLLKMVINFEDFMELMLLSTSIKVLSLRRISFDHIVPDEEAFSALLALVARNCPSLKRLELADCPGMSQMAVQTFVVHRWLQVCSNTGASYKRMDLFYRSTPDKLIRCQKVLDEMRNIGLDFEQECGVDYTHYSATSLGSSWDSPVFC